MRLGIVCGLRSEAKALGLSEGEAEVSGADATRAFDHACRLAREGAEAIVSVGLAGALATPLRAGQLFLPEAVVAEDGRRFSTGDLPGAKRGGVLLGSDSLVISAGHKARLREATAADAVDMESQGAARAAAEAGLPLFVVRAISDDAGQSLPAAARGAVRADGSVDTLRTLLRLLRRPQDFAPMMRLGRQASAGHETLRGKGRELLAALRTL